MASVYIIDQYGEEIAIERGSLLLPYRGNWTFYYAQAASNTLVNGRCQLVYFGKKMPAYVVQTGINEGSVSGVLCGGYGGLSKNLKSQFYDSIHAYRVPIDDMMNESGEILSKSSTLSVLMQSVPQWTRKSGKMGDQLSDICDLDGSLWRVLTDGTIFVGKDTWSNAQSFNYNLLKISPAYVSCQLSVRELGLVPGVKFNIKDDVFLPVGCVEYTITPSNSLAKIWFLSSTSVSASTEDRLHSGLTNYIREVMRGVDFLAQYPGEIVVQRSDKTVDFRPDSSKIPPMTSVKLSVHAPGVKLNIPAKTRATLGFKNGNPSTPEIVNFSMGSGGRPAARKNDKVNVGRLNFSAVGMGVLEGTYTPPGELLGIPFTLGTDILLKGLISEGSDIVEYS